jgi:prevent-host-death family protein
MKKVTVRTASRRLPALLALVERGEEILITKRGVPVAVISPCRAPAMAPERQAAIARAIELMAKGLPWGDAEPPFTRAEMHER